MTTGWRHGRALTGGPLALCLAAAVGLAACGNATPSPTGAPAVGSATGTPSASSAGTDASSASAATGPASTSAGPGTNIASSAAVTAALLGVHLPSPLSRAVVATIGGEVLVVGGVTPSGTTSAILRLNPAAASLTRVGRLASAVHDASGAPLGQGWLVIGGGRVVANAVVQDVSVSGAKASASVTGSLPAPRADGASVAVGSAVLVVGGGRGGVPDPVVLSTSDGAHFKAIARLPVAVRYPAVAAAGNLVYLFGGTTVRGASNAIQVLDATTGKTRVVARLPYALAQATAFTLGGRILIAGGMRGSRPSTAILAFDPATGRASVVGRLPVAVADAGVAVVGDTAYLVGGETGTAFLDTVIAIR